MSAKRNGTATRFVSVGTSMTIVAGAALVPSQCPFQNVRFFRNPAASRSGIHQPPQQELMVIALVPALRVNRPHGRRNQGPQTLSTLHALTMPHARALVPPGGLRQLPGLVKKQFPAQSKGDLTITFVDGQAGKVSPTGNGAPKSSCAMLLIHTARL
jgi:hypothetical protein